MNRKNRIDAAKRHPRLYRLTFKLGAFAGHVMCFIERVVWRIERLGWRISDALRAAF